MEIYSGGLYLTVSRLRGSAKPGHLYANVVNVQVLRANGKFIPSASSSTALSEKAFVIASRSSHRGTTGQAE